MRPLFAAALVLLLAACELLPDRSSSGASGERSAAPVISPPPEIAAVPPDVPPIAPLPALEPMDPKRLVGLTRAQVTDLIGPPENVSESPPATVWAYRTDGCRLDVMFYMDLGTQTFRALAYEVHPAQKAKLAETDCLARIRAGRNDR